MKDKRSVSALRLLCLIGPKWPKKEKNENNLHFFAKIFGL